MTKRIISASIDNETGEIEIIVESVEEITLLKKKVILHRLYIDEEEVIERGSEYILSC